MTITGLPGGCKVQRGGRKNTINLSIQYQFPTPGKPKASAPAPRRIIDPDFIIGLFRRESSTHLDNQIITIIDDLKGKTSRILSIQYLIAYAELILIVYTRRAPANVTVR